MVGLVLFSLVLGSDCWISAIKMLSAIDSDVKEEVLVDMRIHLSAMFNDIAAQWVYTNWRVMEQQHIDLL